MHVYNRLSSLDESENTRILELLDLENSIGDKERKSELQELVTKYIVSEFDSTNTEQDLCVALKKRPHLNDVPLVVKKHFGLEGPSLMTLRD